MVTCEACPGNSRVPLVGTTVRGITLPSYNPVTVAPANCGTCTEVTGAVMVQSPAAKLCGNPPVFGITSVIGIITSPVICVGDT